ncbi:GMC oxidoreductase [Novosphingobium beihaiensis]|uniref:GMC oxidoreductase n=1 Tax=Novosphingobium beihaiensis TaxID=2930389 RepID=A0ABT0BR83_9SPHN|nr:GMC oxidoreductase [Novosphingobium beihaiensis]MCJ2187470.1 GMC oxidoreductase [Novosphingobium beihaiensis]
MIRDLAEAGDTAVETEFLVIGAGTVGLPIATMLARAGKQVHCIESGGRDQAAETHPFNHVEQGGMAYVGADQGRFRCLGGTSTRWGGALIPFLAHDMADADWPVGVDELAPQVERVEKLFGLQSGRYEEPDLMGGPDHIARLAKWPPFRKRNVYNLLKGEVDSAKGPVVWLNASATSFEISDGKLASVTAQALSGSTLRIAARTVIFAAGAIETTRLLLIADHQNSGVVRAGQDILGRYFHDHLSTVVADLQVFDRKRLNELVGFRFAPGGGMRNVRFELCEDSVLRSNVPPCFAHIAFDDQAGSGFDALRDLFRRLQRRQIPSVDLAMRLASASPWLARAVWWRFVQHRLLYPDRASLQMHMVVEQAARRENRISLSPRQLDPFGQPVARIDWTIGESDYKAMHRATEAFCASWQKSAFADLAQSTRRPAPEIEAAMAEGGGIYHPGGTTRMGRSRQDGVVDRDMRLFSLPNVRVLATSVLPTGGGANPTMTLLLLAMRCVDDMLRHP